MGYIERQSRDLMLLLPASVDDYVAADNAVRFIAAFVDDLDLRDLALTAFAQRQRADPAPIPRIC